MARIEICIEEESHVVEARSKAERIALDMGLDQLASAEVALAVSELAQNTLDHAEGGQAIIELSPNAKILTIWLKDNGPGITNKVRALTKGFTTKQSSLGIGLDVVKKSVDEMNLVSTRGQGTVITIKKFLPFTDDEIEYGVISLPDDHYQYNGDDYFIKEFDGDKVLVAVIDGTGEGYEAHNIALLVKEYLESHYRKPLSQIVKNLDKKLKSLSSELGFTIGLALIKSSHINYLGVGDTHAYIINTENKELLPLANHDGTVGLFNLPTLKPARIDLQGGEFIIFCTDGIKNIDHIELPTCTAQQLATSIFSDFHRPYGDATVLVVKVKIAR